jgi:hypothetical protein
MPEKTFTPEHIREVVVCLAVPYRPVLTPSGVTAPYRIAFLGGYGLRCGVFEARAVGR